MSKKGFSLIEILVALGILGIMTGIATVSYQSYKVDTEKSILKQHGDIFAHAVQTCIRSAGGWKVKGWINNTTIRPITPCRVPDSDPSSLNDPGLKTKLGFTCHPKADCRTFSADSNEYFCLSIEKEVSGKNLQVIVQVSTDNPDAYNIWCGSPTAFIEIKATNCQDANKPDFKKGDDCWK